MPELERINQALIPMGRELGIPFIATNDTHYLNKEDASVHDLLLCIGTNATVKDENRLKMHGPYFYLKTQEEMAERNRLRMSISPTPWRIPKKSPKSAT